jgi:hypothetical protein
MMTATPKKEWDGPSPVQPLTCPAIQNGNGQLGIPNLDDMEATDFPWPGMLHNSTGSERYHRSTTLLCSRRACLLTANHFRIPCFHRIANTRGSETDADTGRQRLQRQLPGACAARDMRVGFYLCHYEERCGAGDGCFKIWSGETETRTRHSCM